MLDYTFGTWLWIFEIRILKNFGHSEFSIKYKNFGNQTSRNHASYNMDDRTEPNNCTGTNWYGGTRFWYDIIWFGSWYEIIWFGSRCVILVRNFGSKLSGSVRGTKFWYETQWFGSCSDSKFVISEPVRNGSVRFVLFKKLFFFGPNRFRTTYWTK